MDSVSGTSLCAGFGNRAASMLAISWPVTEAHEPKRESGGKRDVGHTNLRMHALLLRCAS